MVNLLRKIVSFNKNNGVWAISCSAHILNNRDIYYSERFRVPEWSKNSMSLSIRNWL
jgi:hypothetical protein